MQQINWFDPIARLRLLERVGHDAYQKAHAEWMEQSTVDVIAGHAIRAVGSQFGRLFAVGQTRRAFKKREDAEAFAKANPVP